MKILEESDENFNQGYIDFLLVMEALFRSLVRSGKE